MSLFTSITAYLVLCWIAGIEKSSLFCTVLDYRNREIVVILHCASVLPHELYCSGLIRRLYNKSNQIYPFKG